jgi:signal peptidase I
MNRKPKQQKSALREWIESIVIAFVLAMFIRTFVIQAFKIPTGSMRTTLLEGDRILVNKLRYGPKIPWTDIRLPGFTEPGRGDVIVFIYPEDKTRDFIKRLIAKGGETVEIKDGDIFVDGELIKDPVIKNTYYYNRGEYGEVGEKIKVPQGQYFVLGDNSASSRDSRYWGFVPEDLIIGRAELIYWPPRRIRVIE